MYHAQQKAVKPWKPLHFLGVYHAVVFAMLKSFCFLDNLGGLYILANENYAVILLKYNWRTD